VEPSEKATPRISRRSFLTGVTGAGAVVLLAACGGNATATPAQSAAQSTTSSSSAAASSSAASGSTTSAAAASTTSAAAAPQGGPLKNVARNRTLVLGITGTQLTDFNTFNPFLPGISTSTGFPYVFEAPFYYNSYYTDKVCGPDGMSCKDGIISWLGEKYEYNSDFTEATLTFRKGVEWSDGQPFTAKDVVFTINMLKNNAPKMTWSIDMKTWVKDIQAPDDQTVKITLTNPNPDFVFQFFTFHQDIGIQIVPEHIWKDQDPTSFTYLDLQKGWPVGTSPWKMVATSAQQRVFDRTDTWWAKKTNFHDMPAMERIIVIPGADETKMVQLEIANEADLTIDLRPTNIKAVMAQNKKVTSWSGDQPPYGYRDWWPVGLGFNDMKAPFDDKDIRWAINYVIDRKQIVEVGYQGAGEPTLLPFPNFPALQKFLDKVKDLADKIAVMDPAKSAATMQAKGYTKNGDGLWTKDGKTIPMVISCPGNLFQDIAPILVQQLRKGGFDASFKLIQGPDFGTNTNAGNIDAFLLGHGGSVRTPYFTLRLYETKYSAPTGQAATYPYRWSNADYDKIVDQLGTLGETDPKQFDLFRQAMEIWVDNLPDIGIVQWFHRIPTNTTYWTNWPSEQNPYINSAYWHRTAPLWIYTIKAAQ